MLVTENGKYPFVPETQYETIGRQLIEFDKKEVRIDRQLDAVENNITEWRGLISQARQDRLQDDPCSLPLEIEPNKLPGRVVEDINDVLGADGLPDDKVKEVLEILRDAAGKLRAQKTNITADRQTLLAGQVITISGKYLFSDKYQIDLGNGLIGGDKIKLFT
jgi:hypothetical protein